MGLPWVHLVGSVAVRVNTTGRAVDETIPMDGDDIHLVYADGTEVNDIRPTDLDVLLIDEVGDWVDSVANTVADVRADLEVTTDEDGNLVTNSVLAERIPGIGASVDEMLGLSPLLDVGEYLQNYLHPFLYPDVPLPEGVLVPVYGPLGPTLNGLMDYLHANHYDYLTMKLTPEGFRLGVDYSASYHKEFPLDFGASFDGLGLKFETAATLDVGIDADIDFDMAIDWAHGSFAFNVNKVGLVASATTDDLYLGARIGPLEVSIGEENGLLGSGSLELGGSISYVNGVFNFTPAQNGISLNLPIFASLAGINLAPTGVPTVYLNGSMFGNNAGFSVTTKDFDKFFDFKSLTVTQIIQMFPDFRDWLEEEVQTQDSFITQIPFVKDALSQVLVFANAFDQNVYQKINWYRPRTDLLIGLTGTLDKDTRIVTASGAGFTDNMRGKSLSFLDASGKIAVTFAVEKYISATQVKVLRVPKDADADAYTNKSFVVHKPLEKIQTLQELTKAVNASGVLPAGIQVTYDPVTQVLALPLVFTYTMPTLSTPVNFGFDLGAGFGLSTSAVASLNASIDATVTFFIDMDGKTYPGTDGALTAGSTSFTSQAVKFTADMVDYGVQIGQETYTISQVVNEHTVTLDRAATAAASGLAFTVKEGTVLGIDKARIGGTVTVDVSDFNVDVNLGFIGARAGGQGTGSGIHVAATAAIVLDRDITRSEPDNNPDDMRFTIGDIFSGEVFDAFHLDFQGDAWAKLKGLKLIAGTGAELPIAPNAEIGIYVQDFLDWSTVKTVWQSPALPFDLVAEKAAGNLTGHEVVIVLPDLGEAFNFKNISFRDIIVGLNAGLTFLNDSLEGQKFYEEPLPIINRSLKDEFTFARDLAARIQNAGNSNAEAIQEVEHIIEEALGLHDDNTKDFYDQGFALRLRGQTLDIHVNFYTMFEEKYNFSFDLATFIPELGDIDMLNDLLGGSGNIRLQAYLNLVVDIGVQFGGSEPGQDFEIFLYDYKEARETTVSAPASAFTNPGFASGSSEVTDAMYQAIKAQFQAAMTAARTETTVEGVAGVLKSVQATIVSAIDGSIGANANTDNVYGAGQLLGRRQVAIMALAGRLSKSVEEGGLGIPVTLLLGKQVTAANAAAMNAERGFQDVKFVVDKHVTDDRQATGTHITLAGRIVADNLDLGFRLGPIEAGVTGGYAVLDGDANKNTDDYVELVLGLDQVSGTPNDDGKYHIFSETLGDSLYFDLKGGFDVSLPIQLYVAGFEFNLNPPLRIHTNDALYPDHGLLNLFKGSPNAFLYSYPDIEKSFEDFGGQFSIISLINDPSVLVNGVDFMLGGIQDIFGSGTAQSLPLIGDKLKEASAFLGDVRTGFLADLRAKVCGNGKLIDIARQSLFDVFGPGMANILLDSNMDGLITPDDVSVGWYDKNGKFQQAWALGGELPTPMPDAIQFNLKLGGRIWGGGFDIPIDFNIPGFALKVDGGLALDVNWSFDFGFGLSMTDTFYFTTNTIPNAQGIPQDNPNDPEFEFNVGAFLDGSPEDPNVTTPFTAEGTLLFFKATLEDQDRYPTTPGFQAGGLYGSLNIGYTGNQRGRLTIDHVMSQPLDKVFQLNFGVDTGLKEALTLEVAGAAWLPKIKADLIIDWGWDLKNGASTPIISLENFRLDVGTLITNFLKPISQKIKETLDPFKDFVFSMTDRRDFLADLGMDDPTIKGLINLTLQMMGKDPINWAFLDAAKSMIKLADEIDSMIGMGGEIYLGKLIGLGTKAAESVKASQAEINANTPPELKTKMDQIQKDSEGGESNTGNLSTVNAKADAFSSPGFASGSAEVTDAMYTKIKGEFETAIAEANQKGKVKSLKGTVVAAIDGSKDPADLLASRQQALLALATRLQTDLGVEVTLTAGTPVTAENEAKMNEVRGFQSVSFQVDKSVQERSGFKILEYILDINNWMKMIQGGDATLFTYEMPLLEFKTDFDIPIFKYSVGVASLEVGVFGEIDAKIDLAFGYDTYGIRKTIECAVANPNDAAGYFNILDGMYISDWTLPEFKNRKIVPNTGGKEKDEFSVEMFIGLKATVDIANFIRGGVIGGVEIYVGADLQDIARSVLEKSDPDEPWKVTKVNWVSDGKIRGSEIWTMLTYDNNLGPANLFNLHIKGDFVVEAFADIFLGKWKPIDSSPWELIRINLFDVTIDAPHVMPHLAHQEGDTLYIHAGTRAGDRKYFNTGDANEAFILTGSGGMVNIEYDGWYTDCPGSSTPFYGVHRVVADMGEGDDTFDASHLDDVYVTVTGGNGKDTLIAGSAGGYLYGGDGDDKLTGGSGNDILIGGIGADKIMANAGDDILDGGAGADMLNGGEGNDTFRFADGWAEDRISDSKGDTIVDMSMVTQAMVGTLDGKTAEFVQGDGNRARFSRIRVTKIILGLGDDVLYIKEFPDRTFDINDPGGDDDYRIRMGRPNSNKATGTFNITDLGGDFDEIALEQTTLQFPLYLDTWLVLNGREVVNYGDGIERLTLMGKAANYDQTNIIDHGADVYFVPANGKTSIDLKTTGLRILGRDVNLPGEKGPPAVDLDLPSDVKAGHVVVDSYRTFTINERLNAGNDGYIDIRVYQDGASIHIADDLLVSAGDTWNGDGAGWVRLTAPDGSIVNDNGSTIEGDGSHLILKAHDAIGTLAAPILTEVASLTAATDIAGAGDVVVVEADDLSLIAQGWHAAHDDPGLIIPAGLEETPKWVLDNTWDDRGADWLNQIRDTQNVYALASGNGQIDLTLTKLNSRLTLQSGKIVARATGSDIVLRADDFNFLSGDDQIQGTGDLRIRSANDAIDYRVGGSAELTSGDDRSDQGDDGAADLSMLDMAAIAHDFELVTIGHRYDGNGMWIGDVEDATTIRATGEARIRNAALQNHTIFLAEYVAVQGDVQAPGHVVEVQSRLLEVQARNVHEPAGLPDSGLYGRQTLVNVEEQSLVSGWIKADDLVRVNVWGTTGTNPLITYPDGPNSLRTDTGSLIQTLSAGSLIDIDTVKSIKQASTIEAQGVGSQIDIDAVTSFQNLEGGLIAARDGGSHIAIDAGTYLWAEPGSAITAGARFDMVGETPVPVLVGADATIALTSPSELWVGGSVTSSGTTTLATGPRNLDHADYFDAIPGAVLAETTNTSLAADLEAGTFPDGLRPTFTANNLPLGDNVTVSTLITSKRWLADDGQGNRYVLYLFDAENDGTPESLQVLKPHYLIGHRGFSFLLTGTMTVLGDGKDLSLEAQDDVIVRGNINVLGQGGDLTLQSDKWVYWEGFAKVVGDITLYGGLKLDGTDLGGADAHGASVYVHPTSRLVTSGAGTHITLQGSQDVDVLGAVVAGGSIGETGVTWAGPDSTVSVTAGQQVYVDTGLLAAKSVAVHGGIAGADDNRISVLVTTAGGLTSAGVTSDGSGGLVEVAGGTDVQIMGNLLSGGTMYQQFDEHGNRIGESFVWSPEDSTLRVQAGGQAWIGGMTVNRQGETVETGGYLRANERIEIVGGANPEGVGVKIAAASEVMAVNPAAAIVVDSTGDADIQGYLVAGGIVERVYDATGQYLGRNVTTYNGDSTIRIEADNQIRLGLDLKAGKSIDMVGGLDPVEPGDKYSGLGIVLYGSVQMSTWRPDSQINLNAPGPVSILAPAHTQQIKADTFVVTSDGKLTGDVRLDVWLDKVDFEVEASVTVTAAAAADNTGIEDLMADLQSAFDGAAWIVSQSDNPNHPVGSSYSSDLSDPSNLDVKIKLHDSRLLFASPYDFRLKGSSENANLLGLTALAAGDVDSSLPYALYAPQPGSTINIGAPAGPNGKLYIAGKVLAHSAIHLYSGVSPDGMDVDLDATGLLQTVDGSIALNPGANAVIRGDVIAGGAGSDVTVTATNSLQLHGSLEAQRNVILSAGTAVQPGAESIRTYGTSSIRSVGGDGQIIVTGLNDVAINSQVGPGSVDLSLVRLASTAGNLVVEKESGRIETGALLEFFGHDVEIAGVVTSTGATPAADDFEVTVDIDGTATLHGDIRLAGSLLVDAADIQVYDQMLQADVAGQRLRFDSDGPITFGRFATALGHPTLPDGQLYQQGAVVSSSDLAIRAAGLLTVGSGVLVISSAPDSTLQIDAGAAVIVGTLYGGALRDADGDITWLPGGAVEVRIGGDLTFGGQGVDETGAVVTRGGTVQATDHITLDVGGTLSQNSMSALDVDATAGGVLTPAAPGQITVTTQGDLQVFGLVQTADAGSQVRLSAAGQVFVDGVVRADRLLAVQGGTHASGAGILVMPLLLQTDGLGHLVDDQGRLIDEAGHLINAAGKYVDADGNVLTVPPDSPVQGGDPVRLSGGELKTAAGGRITLDATDGISLQGAVGGLSAAGGALAADTLEIIASSTAGAVTVTGRVDAADNIDFTGAQINVLSGGTVKVYQGGGDVRFRASDTAFVQAAAGTLDDGLVQAPDLVHLAGGNVRVYGHAISTAGRVLLSAVEEVDVQGTVSAATDVEVNAGVNAAWTDAQLESGTIVRADLAGGSVNISGAGSLQAGVNVRLTAGADLTVASASELQDGTKPRPRPLVTTEGQTIYVVTGYHQVAVGTVVVPEVTWVETRVTEQVGMEEVKIGSVFYTMDTTLTQDGYYNPRAPEGQKFRETFVEGVDYYNSTDYQHGVNSNIPVIDWAAFGFNASYTPSSNYRATGDHEYRMFTQLSDDQRNAVLATLGYMRLYDFSYSNPLKHQTIDGNPTEQTWTPDWAGSPLSIYYVDVAGWNNRYIRMPQGANEDVLRVVSQGEPTVWYEDVGEYRDLALVRYTQDRSYLTDHQESDSVPNWLGSYHTDTCTVDDWDNSAARWWVSYNTNGRREWSITDGRSSVLYGRIPDWEMSTNRDENVGDSNNTNVSVQTGYRPVTASITNRNTAATYWRSIGRNPQDQWHVSHWTDGWTEGNWHVTATWQTTTHNHHWEFVKEEYNYPAGTHYYEEERGQSYTSDWDGVCFKHQSRWYTERDNSYWTGADVWENQYDYNYDWTSVWTNINDTRQTLHYQWVSNDHDIYGKRPRYETYDTSTKVVQEKTITLWEAEPIVEPQTTLVASRMPSSEQVRFGEFASEAIRAGGAVQVAVGGNATVGGLVTAVTGAVTMDAGANLSVQGLLPVGRSPLDTLAAEAVIQSPTDVRLTAGASLNLGEAAKLTADVLVQMTAGTTATLSGQVTAGDEAVIRAGTNLMLDGVLSAGDLIDARAGQGAAGVGSITGTFYAELTAANPGGDIVLHAGDEGGSVTLTDSLLTAADRVEISAPAGAVSHGPGGTIIAPEFFARSRSGVAARTDASVIDVAVSSAGDIALTNLRAVTLRAVAADGGITVVALGTITAPVVEARGDSDRNSVSLSAQSPAPGTMADLLLGSVVSSASGDLALRAQGSITSDRLGSLLVADELTVEAWMDLDLMTQVNRATLKSYVAGDMSITQQGTGTLTLSASVRDGGLTVNHPGGSVVLEDVLLATNADDRDVTVTAGGDILIARLIAGMYCADVDDLPEPGADADAGVHSLGDVTLMAGGLVAELGDDAAVDLVADVLTVSAPTGFTGLEVAVNELNVATAEGSIDVHDFDGAGEAAPGMVVTSAAAPAGSVTIVAEGYLEIRKVVATGVGRGRPG